MTTTTEAARVQAFIAGARAELAELTDSPCGTQMHRRAVVGKRLVVHVHAWDKTARVWKGGCRVDLRVEGQYVERNSRVFASTAAANAFAADVQAALDADGGIGLVA